MTVAADDSHITYIGRFDHKDPKAPAFSWSNTQIGLSFNGSTELKAHFTAPGPGMRVLPIVDGVAGEPIMVGAKKSDDDDDGNHANLDVIVPVATGLSASSPHTVVLWKITEDTAGSDGDAKHPQRGTALFHGFQLSAGATLQPPPARLPRRLEFVGDSDTAGWCADGTPSNGYDTAHKCVRWSSEIVSVAHRCH
jgi:hypothetical protein